MIAVISLQLQKKFFGKTVLIKEENHVILKSDVCFYSVIFKDTKSGRFKMYKKLVEKLKKNNIKYFYVSDSILKSYLLYQNFISQSENDFMYIKINDMLVNLIKRIENVVSDKTAAIFTDTKTNVSTDAITLLAKNFKKLIIFSSNPNKFDDLVDALVEKLGVAIVVNDEIFEDKINADFILMLNEPKTKILEYFPENSINIIPNVNLNVPQNTINGFGYNINKEKLQNKISPISMSSLLYRINPDKKRKITKYYCNGEELYVEEIINTLNKNNQNQSKPILDI